MEPISLSVPQHPMSARALVLLLAGFSLTFGAQAWGRQDPSVAPPGLAGGEGASNRRAAEIPERPLSDQIADALANGNLKAAQKLVHKFLDQPGLPVDALLHTGVGLAQYDLYPEAADVFGRCVKDYPSLALAELALGKYSEALATLAQAPRTSSPGEVARTYLRGKIEADLGHNAEAERDLSAAFAAAPGEENYALDLGIHYIRAYNYQQALAVFQQATSSKKDSPFLQLGLGLAQFLAGQSAESIETCRTLLALQPDFSTARVMMAFGLYMRGKIDEAAKIAGQGLHDPHPFAYLYYLHAVSLLKLQSKDYALILNDLTLAAQAIPNCSLCYLARSKVHERKGDTEEATTHLEKAVGMDPTFAEAWYRLASLYDQTGQHGAAQQARQRFEELKESKTDRETEMLRNVFLKALGGEGSPYGTSLCSRGSSSCATAGTPLTEKTAALRHFPEGSRLTGTSVVRDSVSHRASDKAKPRHLAMPTG